MKEKIEVGSVVPSRTKLPSLNGLRALSIFVVIACHCQTNYNLYSSQGNSLIDSLVYLLTDGFFGVNVFFVISGFLITFLLLQEEKEKQTVSLKKFYVRRVLRIFPAYYFYLIVLIALQLVNLVQIPAGSWLTAFTFTKFLNWRTNLLTAHAWSLSVEELFYLFWPLLFKLGDKARKRVAISFVLLMPLVKILYYYSGIDSGLYVMLRVDAIAIGCLIALYKDELLKRFENHLEKMFYCALLGIFLLQYEQVLAAKFKMRMGFFEVPLGSTTGLLADIFIGIILMYSVFGRRGRLFRILNSKVLNYIGLLSYSIYLWQQIFTSGMNFWVTSMPQNLLFIIVAALFSYYIIEKPFLKLKDSIQYSSENASGKKKSLRFLWRDTDKIA